MSGKVKETLGAADSTSDESILRELGKEDGHSFVKFVRVDNARTEIRKKSP